MRSRPTAGQASTEYVAAIALVAVVLMLAAPAVGAPNLAGTLAHKLRLGICVVAGDICSNDDARAAGVGPCALSADIRGRDASVTAFSVEIGGRSTLTVTPRSDGTVSVVETTGFGGGVSAGLGFDFSVGPVAVDVGVSGSIRERIQVADGWEFPDRATADHAIAAAREEHFIRWPRAWQSVEDAREIAAMAGVAAGAMGSDDRGDVLGLAGSAQAALGARRASDGAVTLYGRIALDGPEFSLPAIPSIGRGRDEWLIEYTFGREGPRELAFRRAVPGRLATRVTEYIGRLDLRDPANLAIARPLIDTRWPWPPAIVARMRAVGDRIATHGAIERAVYDVEDSSKGISGSVRAGAKFGGGLRKIKIHKQLLEAGVRTGGPERERFDCVGQR